MIVLLILIAIIHSGYTGNSYANFHIDFPEILHPELGESFILIQDGEINQIIQLGILDEMVLSIGLLNQLNFYCWSYNRV